MIAEMMAAKAAAEISALSAVRPVLNSTMDVFPHAAYETVDMRNRRYLNKCSNVYDGSIRFFVAGLLHADVIAIAEQLKTLFLAYKETGTAYQIRRCDLTDEGDIYEDATNDARAFYVKSLTFSVRAVKLG